MASYSVERVKSATLTTNTADTVELNHNYPELEIYNRSDSGVLWARADGLTATVAGDDCYVVLPGDALYIPTGRAPAQVSLISSSAVDYTVTGVRA